MKRTLVAIVLTAICFSLTAFSQEEKRSTSSEKLKDSSKIFYILGQQIGGSLQKLETDLKKAEMGGIDMDAFVLGLKSCFSEKDPLISETEGQKIKTDFFAKLREKQNALREELGKKALKEGEDFLAANKEKEGVITTESGLQYKVLKKGSGDKPKRTDKVTVNYRGTLLDGTEFDSSYKRGKPASFRVTGVINGWTEALLLMNVGSKYKLFIPSELAYGKRGSGRNIPPNSALIFEVELVKTEKAKPRPTRPTRRPRSTGSRSNTKQYGPPPPK